jgi:hypothetical protein
MPTLFNPNRRKGVFMIPSGATKSPTPAPPSFTNTYSLSFDGVDDYVSMGNPTALQITGELTLSCWVKITGSTGSNQAFIYKDAAGAGRCYKLQLQGSTNLANFTIFNGGTAFHTYSTSTINDGNWHHIVAVYTPSTSVVLYVDGVAETTNTSSVPASIDNDPVPFELGRRADGVFYLQGSLDEVAVFNTALTPANVTSIYNLGVPNDISSISGLIAWYRNGDNGSYKSPQWLIPENSNVANSRISNYSFSFDGVDDVLIGPDANLASAYTKASWSFWFNASGLAITYICSRRGSNDNYGELFGINSTGKLIGNIGQSNALDGDYTGSTTISTGTWYNVVITYDGSGSTNDDKVKVYLNGSLETLSWIGTVQTELLQSVGAGRKYAIGKAFNGKVDEVAIWYDTTLTPANAITIYNSGIPAESPNFINIRMGENATFSTNWNVPDTVNSPTNDFTSANMTIEDRVGDASNSSNNAVSFNQVEADRETDVPT